MSSPAPDISIITVSYNTRDLLAASLQSVAALQAAGRVEVWVVDNDSLDGSADMVAERFPMARLIRNQDNRGFAAANNQALAAARGRLLFLLNSDARVTRDACEQLQAAFEADASLGIAGSCLLNPDGSVQPSWGSYPSAWSEFTFQSYLYKVWPAGMPYGRRVHPLQLAAYQGFRYVDWVSGAALMLRREVYQVLGGLPEDTFMYAEDVEYCWRARHADFKVAYCPASRVIHLGQASARGNYEQWIVGYTRALLAYYARHATPADQRTVAYLIWGGSRLRLGLWRLAGWLRPGRRPAVASRVAGYAQAAALAQESLRGLRGRRPQ